MGRRNSLGIEGENMKRYQLVLKSLTHTSNSESVFNKWVQDRILLVWAFIISFVVLDTFFTYLGLNHMGMAEKNSFVALILRMENGWMVWLVLKVLISVLGTAMFFMIYYWVSTAPMSRKDREGVLLFELCGWVYLVSLNIFSLISWSGIFLG